ncbi:hypothetical protein COUCH_21080 [Couchioplanes caeruleus]|uniref:hypothetical protein n=1 Tax=Couchioplanes caeruleus TaxID=56438 RepID=UPI0020BDC43B|nr:hypothetical protein [Couchioplanes caeruleus]UQU61546.1 hypothetical protein COUCH_21080 [Couchioplanes caeruleus]
MAVARTGVRGLSGDDLQMIRDGLAAGRKPRVMFTESAGQIAGQVGQVVTLADPAESDEWVVVRFGRDELPFAPGDLQVAPKGAAVRKAAPPPPAPVRVEPEFVIDKPVPVSSGAAGSGASGSSGAGGRSGGAKPGAVGAPATAPADAPADAPAAAASAAPAPAPRKAPGRVAKPKPPPGLTVTLAYTDGEWTVAANQGAKALAKPYVIRPAEAMRMVSLVDVPGVQEAVEQILAAERAEAEQQAQRLRAELAEIEARLQELRDAG